MCIIVYANIKGKKILAKNRDKVYVPNVKIVREIVDGTEIIYMMDNNTGWLEGMNEYGLGIVNSALNVKYDETEEDELKKKRLNLMNIKENSPKLKINALSKKNLNSMIDYMKNNEFFDDISLQGHTFVASPSECFHIESTTEHKPVIKVLRDNLVLTNHGKNIKGAGYGNGKKLISSILRKNIADSEIKNLDDPKDLLDCMNKSYIDLDPRFHPYRDRMATLKYMGNKDNTKKCLMTTTQIMINLTDLEFSFNHDRNNSVFLGIEDRLPKGYKPKIKLNVREIEKDSNQSDIKLDKKYIDNLMNLYSTKKLNRFYRKIIIGILVTIMILLIILLLYVSFKNKIKKIKIFKKLINLLSI